MSKEILVEMFATGKRPGQIVSEKGLTQISDEGELERVIVEVLGANQKSVEDYRAGKKKALGFIVGQVMKATQGKANPQVVNRILEKKLGSA
jgi:aspartyl-tRNA(Asn)/glutamyl-tRNA(Gln) amidotransferase subunit B